MMPVIPRRPAGQSPLSGPSISPSAFSAPARAAAETGEVVAGLGGQLAQLQEQERNAERTMKSLEIERDMKLDVDALTEGFQGRSDYENFEVDTQKHLADLRVKYQERIGSDKVLGMAFERAFAQKTISLTSTARTKKIQVMTDRATAAYESGFDSAAELFVSEMDPVRKEVLRQNIEIGATQLAAQGLIKETKVGDYVRDFDKRVKTIERDLKVQAREAKAEAKEALRGQQEEQESKFIGTWLDGKLTFAAVLSSNLEPSRKEHWITKIEARAKKLESREGKGWKTDPAVQAELFAKITSDPESVTDMDIANLQGKGLKTDDAKELINYRKARLGKNEDPTKSFEAKLAVTQLNDAKRAGIFDDEDPVVNDKKWAEASVLLQRFVKNNPQGDPSEFVDRLLEPTKVDAVGRLLDKLAPGAPNLSAAEARRKSGLEFDAGPPTIKKLPVGATPLGGITKTIRGVTYKKRDGVWYQK